MVTEDTGVRLTSLTVSHGAARVLDGIDLELAVGVTGLLGPNGAGKSTLMRCLATTQSPSDGGFRALGLDPADRTQRTELRRRLGYLPQNPGYYPHFTAYELVDYVAILKELTDRDERHVQVRRVLEEVGLTDRATTKVKRLSGGMRQRLGLAQALLGDPEFMILDEPTVGLDPEQRMRFRALVSRLGESRTVLFSTHQTEDVAALCERVVVLFGGRVLFDGTPQGLAQHAADQVWLTRQAPPGGRFFWRTADGRYRVLGERPDEAEYADPEVEDGYLLLLGDRAPQAGVA